MPIYVRPDEDGCTCPAGSLDGAFGMLQYAIEAIRRLRPPGFGDPPKAAGGSKSPKR